MCLNPAFGNGTGGTIDVLSPAGGAVEKGTFHVSAQTASAVAIQSVTFVATDAAGSPLGQIEVATPEANTWSGNLSIAAPAFGGGASVQAIMHRPGLPDVGSDKVAIVVDQNAPTVSATWDAGTWWALDAGFSLTASMSDDRSGVAGAAIVLPDGGTIVGSVASGVASFDVQGAAVGIPGIATAVPVGVLATDVAGNQTVVNDASIRIDDEPPAIAMPAFDPSISRTGPLDFTATVTDGTGSGARSASLLIGGAFVSGLPSDGGVFSFHTDLSATVPGVDSIVVLQVIAADNVGNQADAGVSIHVDTIPPTVTDARIDSAADAIDAAGVGWFKGTSFGPAPDIQISALVGDTNLAVSPVPNATVGGTTVSGVLVAGRWTFSIPRTALSVSGAIGVTFDAVDTAGNHVAAQPGLQIHVDDQANFAGASTVDTLLHGPAETVTVAVSVAPPSGFPLVAGSVDFASAGNLSFGSCTGPAAIAPDGIKSAAATYPAPSTLVFNVPMSCAPAGKDGAVGFAVRMTSLLGGAGVGKGVIDVDTAPPVIGDVVVAYPADSGALAWSHDGSHFHRRDAGVLFSFAAYDCHGLASALPSITGLAGASVSVGPDTRAILTPTTCASAAGVTVQRYTVIADLSRQPTSAVPAEDNALPWSASLGDAFGNQGSASGSVNVTRRLWRSAATPLSFLALGPRLFATGTGGVLSFDPLSGAQGTWATLGSDMPLIAPNAGVPALIHTAGSAVRVGDATAVTAAEFQTCSHGNSLDGYALVDASTVVYQSSSDVWDGTCLPACIADACGATTCANCVACQNTVTQSFVDSVHLSGASATCVAGGTAPAPTCNGAPGPTTLTNRVSSANPAVFVGLSGGAWVLTDSAGATLDSIGGLATPTWPLIDGSSPPLVYLPGLAGNAGRLEPRVLTSPPRFGAAPFLLPVFPGAITDMQLARNGILYVLSNNVVHAVITDSTGGATAAGGTQVSAWPSQCRDPCRSSNAGIQCPF